MFFLDIVLTLLSLKINRKSKLLNVTCFLVSYITYVSSISFELYNKIFYYLNLLLFFRYMYKTPFILKQIKTVYLIIYYDFLK